MTAHEMPLLYVAGPYRSRTLHGVVKNIRAAEAVALELWRAGFAVICPHKNTALMDGEAPDSVWLEGDLVMLQRCDGVVMMPGWQQSVGATAERECAMRAGIPVIEWPALIRPEQFPPRRQFDMVKEAASALGRKGAEARWRKPDEQSGSLLDDVLAVTGGTL